MILEPFFEEPHQSVSWSFLELTFGPVCQYEDYESQERMRNHIPVKSKVVLPSCLPDETPFFNLKARASLFFESHMSWGPSEKVQSCTLNNGLLVEKEVGYRMYLVLVLVVIRLSDVTCEYATSKVLCYGTWG